MVRVDRFSMVDLTPDDSHHVTEFERNHDLPVLLQRGGVTGTTDMSGAVVVMLDLDGTVEGDVHVYGDVEATVQRAMDHLTRALAQLEQLHGRGGPEATTS